MKERTLLILIIAVLLTAGATYITYYTGLPIVYWSTCKDECVSIRIDGEIYDCSEFKELKKYEKVWVK